MIRSQVDARPMSVVPSRSSCEPGSPASTNDSENTLLGVLPRLDELWQMPGAFLERVHGSLQQHLVAEPKHDERIALLFGLEREPVASAAENSTERAAPKPRHGSGPTGRVPHRIAASRIADRFEAIVRHRVH